MLMVVRKWDAYAIHESCHSLGTEMPSISLTLQWMSGSFAGQMRRIRQTPRYRGQAGFDIDWRSKRSIPG
jgi:hypothetical protein